MWYLYILRSLKDDNLYVGISKNPQKRLAQHNAGKTFSTCNRRPFELLHTENYKSAVEARKREKYLKSFSGAQEKQEIIKNLGSSQAVRQ
jgi:putative endonuclease